MLFRAEWDQLLLAARGGDPHALGRLIEAAGEDLRSAAAGVLGRKTQQRLPVDDVFSDALMAVLREIGSLRATNYVGFRYWFASIARNHVRRTLRNARGRPGVHASEDLAETDEDVALVLSAESLDFVRDALLRLPRSQQIAFVLREGLGLAWCTIGFVLERRSGPAARLIHYRAVLRVKEVAATRPDIRLAVPAIQA